MSDTRTDEPAARDGGTRWRDRLSRRALMGLGLGAAVGGSGVFASKAQARSMSLTATDLQDATGTVNVSAAAAPAAGDVLTATSATAAAWSAPYDPGITKQWSLDWTKPDTFSSSDQLIFEIQNSDGSPFSGSFVAKSDGTALITAMCSGLNRGNAHVNIILYVGAANQDLPLYSALGETTGGSTAYAMGMLWYDSTGITNTIVSLSNLTPGATYKWQLMGAIVGASYNNPVSNQPTGIALRTGVDGHVDKGYVACYQAASGGAQVIPFLLGGRGLGNIGQANDSPGIDSAFLPGTFRPYGSTFQSAVSSTSLTNPFAVAFTPDGTQAVAVGFGSNTIHVLDADNDTISHTWTVTGAASFYSVVCDNSYAYLADFYNGKVFKVALATGTIAASATIGAQAVFRIAITPDLSKLVVPSKGSVVILNTSNLSTSSTVNLAGLSGGSGTISSTTQMLAAKVTPDGTAAWVVANTSTHASIVEIVLATGAATAYTFPQSSGTLADIAIAPTGTNAWVTCGGGQVVQIWLTGPYKGQMFVQVTGVWTTMSAVAITNDGQIYLATNTDNHIWEWPGSTLTITPYPAWTSDVCTVVVQGAAS
ncbi:MAG TPA: YncE family protein [Gaiellaceae bacterium]|nr:YncE family protein [Gaiellaceae bacterium]